MRNGKMVVLSDAFSKHLLQFFKAALLSVLAASTVRAQGFDDLVHIASRPAQNPQQPAQTASANPAPAGAQKAPDRTQQPGQTGTPLVAPPGTHISLELARALSIKHTKAGDPVNLQTTFPVVVGGQMAIPPGTFVQGIVNRVIKADRSRAVLTLELKSANVIFATGYTVNVNGPMQVDPVVADLAPSTEPSGGPVPALAATGTTPMPPPLPSMGNTVRNVAIGLGAASIAGVVVVALTHHNDLVMQEGTRVDLVLAAPLVLDRERVMAAVQKFSLQAAATPPAIPKPPVKTCSTPDSPGTPDVIIPGTDPTVIPGTPDTVIPGDPPTVIPGTPPTVIPGDPPTVIPGTPPTSGSTYPCRP